MSSRMRRPETVTLNISQGDWLVVKKRLTAGEYREWMRFAMKPDGQGIDPLNYGLGKVVAYLLDWSITDADNSRIDIVGQPREVVASALNALSVDDWTEILKAIEAHEAAMEKEAETEKNAQATGNGSSQTLPSVA
jgi:hypothetical protein